MERRTYGKKGDLPIGMSLSRTLSPTEPEPAPAPEPSPSPTPSLDPPPNRFKVVQRVAAEKNYPNSGMRPRDFTQIVAQRLARKDANWGRWLKPNGRLAKDHVAYRNDGQNDNPFSIDILTGGDSTIQWKERGLIGGTWIPAN